MVTGAHGHDYRNTAANLRHEVESGAHVFFAADIGRIMEHLKKENYLIHISNMSNESLQ